ncbi:MAG: hypothetical protein KHX03_06685 [Clostridium sp.]|nr:hypothetical protein [Clostridium sp.]
MPVNSIKNLTLSQHVNQSFKSDSNKTKTDAKTSSVSESSDKKSKLPYIAGAIVLAGMGVFLANRLHKPKSAVPKPDGKLGEELNKAAEEIKNKAQEVKEKAKEAAQTVKEKADDVAQEVKEKAKEAVQTVKEKADDVAQEVKEKAKEAVQTVKEKSNDVAQDVKEKVEEKVVEKVKTEVVKEEKASLPAFVNKTSSAVRKKGSERDRKLLDVLDSLKTNAVKREVSDNLVIEFNKAHMEEARRIIGENTANGFVDLKVLEKVGRDFAADKNRADNLKQAANLLEESYASAYRQAHPDHTIEGIEKVYKRITEESHELFDVYAQMPKEDALQRIRIYSMNRLGHKGYNSTGMLPEDFMKKTITAFEEYTSKAKK